MVLRLDLVNHLHQRKVVEGEVELRASVLRRLAGWCNSDGTSGPGKGGRCLNRRGRPHLGVSRGNASRQEQGLKSAERD